MNSSTQFNVYLVKTNEGGHPDVVFFEERHTLLSCVNGVHNDVVQSTTTRGNGDVVLLIYGSKVSLYEQKYIYNTTTIGFCFSLQTLNV